MSTVISPNFSFSDMEFISGTPKHPNTLAGEDLHIPSEEMCVRSKAIFDSDMRFLHSSSISHHDLPRYKAPPLPKDAHELVPKLSMIFNREYDRPVLRASGTVIIFEKDGSVRHELTLNIDVDPAKPIPTKSVPVPAQEDLPFKVAATPSMLSGCSNDVQTYAINVLLCIAEKAHGRQFDGTFATWFQLTAYPLLSGGGRGY